MVWTLLAAALFAQAPSVEMERVKEEIRRLESLVAAGAAAPARLSEAKQSLADAEDAAVLHRTLYARIALQDFTEAQAAEMLAAAERRVQRQSERIDKHRKLVAAGVVARADAEPLQLELESRRTVVGLAQSRSQLLQELTEMARSEEAAAVTLTPSSMLGRGGPLIERFAGSGRFNDGDLKRVVLEFEKEFAKPLPISAKGETAVHRAMGFDHRGRVDVGVVPDSEEGRWMRKFLAANKIPYIAFRRSIAGQATAAHIHIGTPSPKLAPSTD
jgi:hypothetical protein